MTEPKTAKKVSPPPLKITPPPLINNLSTNTSSGVNMSVVPPTYMSSNAQSSFNLGALNLGGVQSTSTSSVQPISLGLPNYFNNSSNNQPGYLPDSGALSDAHMASLDRFKSSSPDDNTVMLRSGMDGQVQFTEVNVSAGGEEGSVQMHDTLVFDPTAAPEDTLSSPQELKLPPTQGRSNPYPIQFSFKREVSYADNKGRILHMEFVSTMGFTVENWRAQAGVILNNNKSNQWQRLRYAKADEASATFLIDGHGMTGDQYLAFSSSDGNSIAFDDLWQALYSNGNGLDDFDLMLLLPPEVGAGQQYSALHSWLEREDYKRWKAAHPDKKWWQQGLDFIGGLGKSVYNNTVGAVIQAGLQLADMERLWMAIWLRKTGLVADDYIPNMWSDMGKAAEQGQGTGDLLLGMGKGMVLAPYRFVKAVQHGDAGGAGEALGDTAFAIEGARGMVKAAPGIWRAGVGALREVPNWRAAIPKLGQGLRDFHANLRAKAAARFGGTGEFRAGNYRHTMAGTDIPSPELGPAETYGPISPDRARLDTAHYDWIDQMHAATRGEGPEPAAWDGPEPTLDFQGRWTGWSPAEAYAAYRAAIRGNRGIFEVIIGRDRMTGQYEVMLGDRGGVNPSANTPGSYWDTVMHYHPNLEGAPRYTLPAGQDVGTAFYTAANAPLSGGRPHIEFVESVINGQPTRTAIVVGGDAQMSRIDLGQGVLGRDPAAGSSSMPYRGPSDYQKFWFQQGGGTRLQSLPGDPVWVPPDSQGYRSLMIDSAEQLGHTDLAEQFKSEAPEYGASPDATRTQAGLAPDVPAKPLTQRELAAQSPAGSPYFGLSKMGMPFRFMNPIGDDEGATLENMHMVQNVNELRELMKHSRLAGGFADNGGALDPSRAMEGEAYWLVIQAEKGQLYLVPSYLVEKGAAETINGLKP